MGSIDATVQSIARTTFSAITMAKPTNNPATTTILSETSSSWSSETIKSPKPVSSSIQFTITERVLSVVPSTTKTAISGGKTLSVDELSASLQHFGWMDYFVFVMMLVMCALIGFYFGFIEKKGKRKRHQKRRGSEALDYLVGGRKMKVFPVSLSLVSSFVSGISLLGTSTEIYVYGTQYAFILITISLSAVISWYVFLPVFCNLQLTSTYEYFERRFDRRIQYFGAVLFILEQTLWLPIAIYVPALTFNQVTGIGIHIITPIVSGICIFYTTVGGIKAVVFADFLQSFVMFGSVFLVMIMGTLNAGGFDVVWKRNMDSGRIELPGLTFDPTYRMSMLSVLIGGTIYRIQSTAISQPAVQRFVSLPSLKEIKQSLIFFSFGLTLLLLSCVYVGLVTYATYYDCDPLSTKLANARDQLVPLLVMDLLGQYPGLAGLFVSAVFSAALSSLSTVLNSMAAVVLEDFAKPFSRQSLTERQTAIVMRAVVVIFGTLAIGLVYIVEKLGMVLQLSTTLQSITQGPMLGIFVVGVCMPWVNSKSVLAGSIVSFIAMSWICIRAQVAIFKNEFITPEKPVSIEGCTYEFDYIPLLNSTLNDEPIAGRSSDHISWLWYGSIGAVITIVGSNIACIVFGRTKMEDIDPDLLVPFLQKYFKDKKYESVPMVNRFDHSDFVL